MARGLHADRELASYDVAAFVFLPVGLVTSVVVLMCGVFIDRGVPPHIVSACGNALCLPCSLLALIRLSAVSRMLSRVGFPVEPSPQPLGCSFRTFLAARIWVSFWAGRHCAMCLGPVMAAYCLAWRQVSLAAFRRFYACLLCQHSSLRCYS